MVPMVLPMVLSILLVAAVVVVLASCELAPETTRAALLQSGPDDGNSFDL